MLKSIETTYKNTKANVITPDGDTSHFDIKAGILQGDTLAPYLFVIILDYIMSQTYKDREEELGFPLQKRKSRRVLSVLVHDLDFADNLALITENVNQSQILLSKLEDEAGKIGITCKAKKTEFQAFNFTETEIEISSRDDSYLNKVQNFKYKGLWMKDTQSDIKYTKALACHNLRTIWISNILEKIKTRLYISTVEYVLLYGSETWTLTIKWTIQ